MLKFEDVKDHLFPDIKRKIKEYWLSSQHQDKTKLSVKACLHSKVFCDCCEEEIDFKDIHLHPCIADLCADLNKKYMQKLEELALTSGLDERAKAKNEKV